MPIDLEEMKDLVRMIREHHYAKLDGKESDFIENMHDRLDQNLPISDKQAEWIVNIFDKYSRR